MAISTGILCLTSGKLQNQQKILLIVGFEPVTIILNLFRSTYDDRLHLEYCRNVGYTRSKFT